MPDFTHSVAILIGIDAYGSGIPRLTTAVNDATRLAELLAAQHGYETMLLTEPAAAEAVTLARLRTLFTQELPARLGDDDRLLVYFAGHGVALDGDDGPRGYLVPQDARPGDSASMLAMTDLHAFLAALPCRHMLAILDCCFAGAFRWASTRQLGALPGVIHKERYDRYLASPAWQVLTSAAYDQTALDVLAGDAKRGTRAGDGGLHSPFALALFDALAGAGDVVPVNQGDGVITASELFVYLQDVVSREAEEQANHEQMPGLWPLSKHRKGEYIFLVPGHPLNLPPAPALNDEANPYRGLKSYDQKHAALFFGREDEIGDLVQRVEQQPFVAVLGASGTGKSSLVKAGVLPRLEGVEGQRGGGAEVRGAEVRGAEVRVAEVRGAERSEPVHHVLPPMRPTDHPVQALATLLHAELQEDLAPDDQALAQIVARWAATHPGQRLVVTIDQFEELATLCRDDGERARFLCLLANAIEQQPEVVRLIITLRTDFEPQFTQAGSPLAGLWQVSRYVVPPMDIEDLRQVIEGPASVRVLYFDPPELVDDLIKEVIQTPGALPLLSFTLSELYVKYVRSGRDDRALSGMDCKALGGVVGSLRNRASEEYDALPDDAHRATMQRVMLRMVAAEGGGELARRRVALSELAYPTAEENGRVKTVLDRLVDARLLVRGTGENPAGTPGEAYVEPAHDALVLAWDKLLRWKKDAEEYLPLQRRLAQAATEWRKARIEAKPGLLWDNDPRLPQVEQTLWPTGGKGKGLAGRIRWARQVLAPRTARPVDTAWVNGTELAFVQTSIKARASFWRRVLGASLLLALVLIAATTISLSLQQRAVQAEATAVAEATRALNAQGTAVAQATRALNAESTAVAEATRALNAESTAVANEQIAKAEARRARAGELSAVALGQIDQDPERALLIAQEAVSVTRTFESEDALRQALRASAIRAAYHGDVKVSSATFSPDGGRVLVIGQHDYRAAAQILAVPSLEPIVTLRDIPGDYVLEGQFSPDGQQVLTVNSDDTVSLWNAQTGGAAPPFAGVAAGWSSDGSQFVVVAPDGTVDVRNAEDGRGRVAFQLPAKEVPETVYFVAEDRLIVVVSRQAGVSGHSARVWSATGGAPLAEFPVNFPQLALSVDRTALAHGDGKEVKVRYASNAFAEPRWNLVGHQEDVVTVSFAPSEQRIAATGGDGIVRVWKLGMSDNREWVGQPRSTEWSNGGQLIAFSPLDDMLITADYGLIRGWDVASTRERFTVRHGEHQLDALEFAPNARYFLTAGEGTVRLWTGRVGEEFAAFGSEQLDLSPDGQQIAAVTGGSIRLQKTGAENLGMTLLRSVEQEWLAAGLPAHMVSFPYDEAGFATDRFFFGRAGGSLTWWDSATGEQAGTLALPAADMSQFAIAPDGSTVALGRRDGTSSDTRARVELWDAKTGQRRELAGEQPPFLSLSTLSFSPDGRLLLAAGPTYVSEGGDDRVVRAWDVATGKSYLPLSTETTADPQRFPAHFGRRTELSFTPDGRRVVVANEEGLTIWNVDNGALVAEISSSDVPISTVAMAFSANGDLAILPDAYSDTARVWDLAKRTVKLQLRGHSGRVNLVAMSADGRAIMTASQQDGTLRIWDGDTGEQLSLLPFPGGRTELSADGRYVLTSPDQASSGSAYPQLVYVHLKDVVELSKDRVTRPLTCEERRAFLRETLDCPVATPLPVSS